MRKNGMYNYKANSKYIVQKWVFIYLCTSNFSNQNKRIGQKNNLKSYKTYSGHIYGNVDKEKINRRT